MYESMCFFTTGGKNVGIETKRCSKNIFYVQQYDIHPQERYAAFLQAGLSYLINDLIFHTYFFYLGPCEKKTCCIIPGQQEAALDLKTHQGSFENERANKASPEGVDLYSNHT